MKKFFAILIFVSCVSVYAQTSSCGETSQSGTDTGNALWQLGTPCATGTNANGYTVSSISYWVGSPTSTSFDLGVYSNSSGAPNSLLCSVSTGTITPVSGWNTVNISGCPTLGESTTYWLGYITGGNTIEQGNVSGACPGTSYHSTWVNAILTGVSLANPFPANTQGSNCYSMYMTLTADSAPPAATPTFSPGAGTYSSAQSVSISDSTSGATIYYTTNGTTPTTSSSVYSNTNPITVTSTETLEAIATATGYSQSSVGTAAYTITTQSGQVTTSGTTTANTVPVFSSSTTITNSPIAVSGSNVGIGTTSPVYPITVAGAGAIGDAVSGVSSASGVPLFNKYLGTTADAAVNYILLSNTYTSTGTFNTSGFDGQIYLYRGSQGGWNASTEYDIAAKDAYNGYLVMRFNSLGSLNSANAVTLSYGGSSYVAIQIPSSSSMDVYITGRYWGFVPIVATASQVSSVTQLAAPYLNIPTGGNVGIGTTAPAYNLDVAGVTRAQQGVIFPDGNKQTIAWTGVLCGGDYAEAVSASGTKKSYEPGDVLVLASDANGNVEKSGEPYSTMVAGIFATKPGVIGRRETLVRGANEIPMAMVGIVPTKVSAENGAIRQGDLLVTSSTTGYAMKGTDRSRMLGAVIGKAMGSLETGTGVIEVLVTLQ